MPSSDSEAATMYKLKGQSSNIWTVQSHKYRELVRPADLSVADPFSLFVHRIHPTDSSCWLYALHYANYNLQSAHIRKCKCCKNHVLQSAHVTKCTCCKVYMLQSACVAKCTCCKVHVLQKPCGANIKWHAISTICNTFHLVYCISYFASYKLHPESKDKG